LSAGGADIPLSSLPPKRKNENEKKMRICDKCSFEIPEGSKYCPECGDIVDENDVRIEDEKLTGSILRIVCPNCEKQDLYNVDLARNMQNVVCTKCNKDFQSRVVQIRAKRSKSISKKTAREFNIRVINSDGTEDLIHFVNSDNQDFELRSKDIGIFSYKKGKIKIVQNSSIGQYMKVGSGCFIATYVYGKESKEVELLRKFRDEILLPNTLLRYLIEFYYFLSPKLIDIFGDNKTFRKISQMSLNRIINILKRKKKARSEQSAKRQ